MGLFDVNITLFHSMNQTSRSQDYIEPLPAITAGSTSKATFIARKKQAMSSPNLPATYQTR